VLSTSLMAGMPLSESGGAAARSMALAGRQVFNTFEDVIRLRRMHRQRGVDAFKDSTMRLRDSVITIEDYALWKTHEVDDVSPEAACPWPGGEHLLREAVLLVPKNAPAGKINGNQLAARAPLHGEPGPASSGHVAVRCEARHSHGRGETRKAEEFRNVHKATHLCVGARVMLSQNRLWDVGTVPLGLMNGARGVVVAILYAAPGEQRVDGSALAGSGFPRSKPGNHPRGLEACPLPDFVVVHFPDYAGPPCFEHLPKTWVPVPCGDYAQERQVRHHACRGSTTTGLGSHDTQVSKHHRARGVRRLLRQRPVVLREQAGACLRGLDTRDVLGAHGFPQTPAHRGLRGGAPHPRLRGQVDL